MGSQLRGVGGYAAVLALTALLAAACSSGSDSSSPATTFVRASTTTTLATATPVLTVDDAGGDQPVVSTSLVPVVVLGLPVSVMFPAIEVIDGALSMSELASGDIDRLEARFRQDERVDAFLDEVDARGVYRDGSLVAVAVAVAVSPGAASTPGFVQSFADGATAGGTVNPVPFGVLDQQLTSWVHGDTGHLLWAYENLFLIVSGTDVLGVRDIASAIITMVIDPPPEPVVEICPEIDPESDDSASASTDPAAEEGEVVCVEPAGEETEAGDG